MGRINKYRVVNVYINNRFNSVRKKIKLDSWVKNGKWGGYGG